MSANTADILIIVCTLIFSAWFSGIEIAFVSISRLKIELKSAQEDRVGILLSKFVKATPRVITTVLVGNNLALVLFGISAARLLNLIFVATDFLEPTENELLALILQTLITTLVILFLGEYLPKAFFRLKAEDIMFNIGTARILLFFYWIFGPLVVMINALSGFFLRKILRLRYEEEELVFRKEDLTFYMQETLSSLDLPDKPEIDQEMFTNAMSFNETRVREFMVPRTELTAISIEDSIEDLINCFVEFGHSKVIVYRDSLDEVLGFVHHSALFQRPKTIQDAMQPILMVPETMAANVLLSEFTRKRRSIAVVVDEFGGTEGMVTIEDLVEEVFGDIEDEHDEPEEEELLAKEIEPNVWLFSARWEVDDLNENHNLGLPEGEYNTLGGMIIHHLEAIPAANDSIELANYRFIITDASENKVNIVRVERADS